MVKNRKGDRRERELVKRLDDAGFAVMRAPASGSATERSLPDVLAGDGQHFYAIEAKSSGGDPIYLDKEECAALAYFGTSFGATPLIGTRFDRDRWHFFYVSEIITRRGAFRVKEEREGYSIADLTEGLD